jgi:hypothetical protein
MSRSRRKTPICGMTTAVTEKADKRLANGALRAPLRVALKRDGADHELTLILKDCSDIWAMDKDGKQWFGNCDTPLREKLMRK